jgi:TorA maturation chaperone TorD
MLHVYQRKKLYALLSALFSYPTSELQGELAEWDAGKLRELFPECPPCPAVDEKLLPELETAYTDLFINRLGGVPAPPYGSVYLEQEPRLMGSSTEQVLAAYQKAGLTIEGSPEPPDYLPTELEFLYFLVDQEEEALQKKKLEAAREALGRQKGFLQQLFSPWAMLFCEKVLEEANAHPLYRWGACLLREFIASEHKWLETALSR